MDAEKQIPGTLVNHAPMRALIAGLAVLGVFALSDRAIGAVPNPIVTGPLPASAPPGDPSHNYPFFSTTVDLAKAGYIEEEFFLEGTANRYDTATGNIIDTGHYYVTRMIVRKPASSANFNGTVLMEWQNVFAGYDFDFGWAAASDHIIRRGYAWVGVSAQRASVHQPNTGLKAWSPTRYGSLDLSDNNTILDDALSFDVYSQAAQAVRNPGAGISPLGNLHVDRVLALGVSQAAIRGLAPYYNVIHLSAGVFDGFLLVGGGGQLRTDLNANALKLLSETDIANGGNQAPPNPQPQPDSDHFRKWEVAGASHVDHWLQQAVLPLEIRDGLPQLPDTPPCTLPAYSRIPYHYVLNAAIDCMDRWMKHNIPPHPAPDITLDASSPTGVARDAEGNALGGIRLSQHAIPTAVNTGVNTPGAPSVCRFFGSYQPFDQATLDTLYRNHGAYVSDVSHVALYNLLRGFLVVKDAAATVQEAAQSTVGKH
jgi:hypothetical protein